MVIVVAGDALVAALDLSGWRYVIITLLALTFATLAPAQAAQLSGSFEIGVGLSFVFFAAIAAGADVLAVSCPYEVSRFEDSLKVLGYDDKMEVMDIVELLAEAMET